jgi:hypothetical protein
MSYSEMVNYEALSLKAKAKCNVAQQAIVHIERLLESIKANAQTIHSKKLLKYEESLLKEKEDILNRVKLIEQKAEEQAKIGFKRMKIGTSEMLIYEHRNDLIRESDTLISLTNQLMTTKLEVLHSYINEELVNIANTTQHKLTNAAQGIINLPDSVIKQLDKIEDITLREAVYREAIEYENQGKPFEQLIDLGQEKLNELTGNLLEKHRQTILEGIRHDMEAARVDATTINQTLNSNNSIQEIRTQATNEIVGEEIRKESLKIILKAIETRGFIVDRKNNIKINKDKNEVLVIGKKASGQTAEFKIYLDGRFSYKFDGFEGQACQKDIEPFMNDLEDIYGMKITGRVELWKNPDKLSSQKYQTYNTNKGKN